MGQILPTLILLILPIVVFDMSRPEILLGVLRGESCGTIIFR